MHYWLKNFMVANLIIGLLCLEKESYLLIKGFH